MSACGRTQTALQGLLAFVRPTGGVGGASNVDDDCELAVEETAFQGSDDVQ